MPRLSELNRKEEVEEDEDGIPLALAGAVALGVLFIVLASISAGAVYFITATTTTTTSTTTTSTTSSSTSTTTTSTTASTTTSTTASTTTSTTTTTTIPCGGYFEEPCMTSGGQVCDSGYAINSEDKCAPMYCSTDHASSGRDNSCGGWVFSQQNCKDPKGSLGNPATNLL